MNRDPQRREGTRDPIFLFQARTFQLLGIPDEYEYIDFETIHDANGNDVSLRQMYEDDTTFVSDVGDCPCVIPEWRTEGVYLTRAEGESYGKSREYNYPDGWRVYCVCSEGELAGLLNALPESPVHETNTP